MITNSGIGVQRWHPCCNDWSGHSCPRGDMQVLAVNLQVADNSLILDRATPGSFDTGKTTPGKTRVNFHVQQQSTSSKLPQELPLLSTRQHCHGRRETGADVAAPAINSMAGWGDHQTQAIKMKGSRLQQALIALQSPPHQPLVAVRAPNVHLSLVTSPFPPSETGQNHQHHLPAQLRQRPRVIPKVRGR